MKCFVSRRIVISWYLLGLIWGEIPKLFLVVSTLFQDPSPFCLLKEHLHLYDNIIPSNLRFVKRRPDFWQGSTYMKDCVMVHVVPSDPKQPEVIGHIEVG